MNNLEFARELQKTFVALGQDVRFTLVFSMFHKLVYSLDCNSLGLCGSWTLLSDPEGGEEVCAEGAAAAGGSGTTAAEDGAGAAIHPRPAG